MATNITTSDNSDDRQRYSRDENEFPVAFAQLRGDGPQTVREP
ncbi:hypothetical protein ACOZ4I_17330 (plasmid) [Haloarcula salina]